ncbi:hypothetical protein H4R34_000352 [Dimargaris verticillata]|uniref:Cyclin-like domain-containing protein n=1 Tax=Dimargaris verticillata TaxID=2761393 RepID=A0A9W8B897_9FUNG|nr:hypothetical protein H4R34_000352 [Dimargaris verticillata]
MPTTDDQWYFRKEDFQSTPSVYDSITPQDERTIRAKGCGFINSVGNSLRFTQTTIATACTLFHRFYMRQSLKTHHHYMMAGTCIFVASKIEEQQRKIRDIVQVCNRKAKRTDAVLSEDSKDFIRWRDNLILQEEVLLEYNCFDLTIEHPYPLLLDYCKQAQASKRLQYTAWAFVNDSYRSYACLLFRPSVVAATALYLAARILDEDLQMSRSDKPWWDCLEVAFSDIEECSHELLDMYTYVPSAQSRPSHEA